MSIKKNLLKKVILFSFIALGLFAVTGFVSVMIVLYAEVRKICVTARKEYNKTCVDSLILVMDSEDKSFKQRNDAVWALGQIADKKALPYLEILYTGKIPNREPLDKTLSQYELRKAIKWCKEGNITNWMYAQRDYWK